jgi:SH3-like domain-containing protein
MPRLLETNDPGCGRGVKPDSNWRLVLSPVSEGSERSSDLRRLSFDHLPPVRSAARASGRARYWLTVLVVAPLLLISCRTSSSNGQSKTPSKSQAPAIGVAFTGPTAVNLREDLGPRATVVATLQHGERLEVLETRRRFVRVRTAKGLEGWTDVNYLLSQQQVSDLDKLAEFAAKLPSQGKGTTFDSLNVHTAPSRQAPSFTQIPEGGAADVLVHRVSPRNAVMPPAAPAKAKAKNAKNAKNAPPKQTKQGKEPPPPPPPAPTPPANWVELSRPRATELDGEPAPAAPVKPVPEDDWYLVRTHDGKAGWVLARQMSMSIPDEVAQYAEGHVITGYLSLGKVGSTDKDNWLWTTTSAGSQGLDFDSFRVFVWSIKRNRYETAYIERNVKGHYPIQAQPGSGEDAAFSVVLEDKDGQIYKKTYAFSGYRVKLVSKEPRAEPPVVPEVRSTGNFEEVQVVQKVSWAEKLRDMRKRWFGR